MPPSPLPAQPQTVSPTPARWAPSHGPASPARVHARGEHYGHTHVAEGGSTALPALPPPPPVHHHPTTPLHLRRHNVQGRGRGGAGGHGPSALTINPKRAHGPSVCPAPHCSAPHNHTPAATRLPQASHKDWTGGGLLECSGGAQLAPPGRGLWGMAGTAGAAGPNAATLVPACALRRALGEARPSGILPELDTAHHLGVAGGALAAAPPVARRLPCTMAARPRAV